MTLQVVETDYGFDISWDPNDPVECVMNDWTEEDFKRIILEQAEKVLAEHTFEEDFMEK